MEYLISALWITIELMSLFLLGRAFLPLRRNGKEAAVLFLLTGLISFVFSVVPIAFFHAHALLRKLLVLLFCISCFAGCFQWKWYGYLLMVSLFYFSLGAMDTLTVYGVSWMLGISVSLLIWKKRLYVMIVTIGKCMILLISFLLDAHRVKNDLTGIGRKNLLRMTVLPIVSFVLLYTMYEKTKAEEDLSAEAVIFSLVLVAANAAVLVMLRNMEQSAHVQQEVALLHQSMALQTENIRSLEKSYREQRRATHEYNHQLQAIAELLQCGKTEAAKTYISELQRTQSTRIYAVNCHHPVIDVILNEKYRIAKEKEIDFHVRVSDLSALALPTDALVVLLSNLLDNALEACEREGQKKIIECSQIMEEELLYLSVRNSSLPVVIHDGRIPTSKKPAREHGFGLAAVRRILEDLHGESAMEYADGFFTFAAEIPLS